ncbi:MAG: hypothetical protein KC425_08275, partial [Anaerolineales bacterium]|nr:hypothetical protein [Anaerolineales bacterium]
NKATVMRYSGGAGSGWEIVEMRGFSGSTIAHPNLVLSSDDVPYLDYTDYANGLKASLMIYDPTPPGPVICNASGSGSWSAVTSHCQAGDTIVIPAGMTVVLDSDIELTGDFEIQGTLDANNKTVTLSGSGDQTLTGPALNFYRLTINKTNKTDTVYIVGKLKVSRKLSIARGKLRSASDYVDVEILVDGTLELSSDITVGGDWTNDGSLIANTYTVTFDGAALQTLGGSAPTAFYNLTIAPGASVFMATLPTAGGSVTNEGTISQTMTLTGSGAPVSFLQISTDKYRGVDITTTDNLGVVSVTVRGNAADCTGDPASPPDRLRCFRVDVETSDFYQADMTFYSTAAEDIITNDTVYQYYAAFGFWADVGTSGCGAAPGEPCTADGVTLDVGPNHFVIGDVDESPTAINLRGVRASAGQAGERPFLAALLVLMGLMVGTAVYRKPARG